MYIVTLPKNILGGGGTAHPTSCTYVNYVYCFLCHFIYVHSTWTWQFCCKYVNISSTQRLHSATRRPGTQRSPFYKPLLGLLYFDLDKSKQDRIVWLWDPWSPVYIVHYLPTTNLWLVFILVILSLNLVVSCPYVSYYLYLHTFMLFRSTCSGIFL